jgi:hypothetical protein
MDINSIDTLRMDGIDYDVSIIEPNELGSAIDGEINYGQQKIIIKNMKPSAWLQTLWHEIIHHIDTYRLRNILSESDIDTIATSINAILLDNPDLTMEIWQVATSGNFTIEDDADADETD